MEQIKQRIEKLFENSDHQEKILLGIYKMYIKNWDTVSHIEGWPVCGKEMWHWICERFIEFDKKNHPGVWPGGLWFNNGFSSSPELGPWEVSLEKCLVEYL